MSTLQAHLQSSSADSTTLCLQVVYCATARSTFTADVNRVEYAGVANLVRALQVNPTLTEPHTPHCCPCLVAILQAACDSLHRTLTRYCLSFVSFTVWYHGLFLVSMSQDQYNKRAISGGKSKSSRAKVTVADFKRNVG